MGLELLTPPADISRRQLVEQFRSIASRLREPTPPKSQQVQLLVGGANACVLLLRALRKKMIIADRFAQTAPKGEFSWDDPDSVPERESLWRWMCWQIAEDDGRVMAYCPRIRNLFIQCRGKPAKVICTSEWALYNGPVEGRPEVEGAADRAVRYASICDELASFLELEVDTPLVSDMQPSLHRSALGWPRDDEAPPTTLRSVCRELKCLVSGWSQVQLALTSQDTVFFSLAFSNCNRSFRRLIPAMAEDKPISNLMCKLSTSEIDFQSQRFPNYHIAAFKMLGYLLDDARWFLMGRLPGKGYELLIAPSFQPVDWINENQGLYIAAASLLKHLWPWKPIDTQSLMSLLQWERQRMFAAENALASLEAHPAIQNATIQSDADPLDKACEPLTPLHTKIVTFLWNRPHATRFETIAEHCWPNRIASDDTIKKRVADIKARWAKQGEQDSWYLTLDLDKSDGKRTIKLIRPGQKLGQK